MGAQGDGIADDQGRPIFVPYALPGEQVKASIHSNGKVDIVDRITYSPDRIEPVCPYFGKCGGCQIQHWREDAYLQWKVDLVTQQLARHTPSLAHPPLSIMALPPSRRRRITLAIRKKNQQFHLGFHQSDSTEIVNIERCFVACDEINKALSPLRAFFEKWLPEGKEIACLLTSADNGLDCHIQADWSLNEKQRLMLPTVARPQNLLRVTWQKEREAPEPLIQIDQPYLHLEGIAVELPAGAFLQPSLEGENILRHLVKHSLEKAKNIADLYCGIGTFSLPLAHKARIYAADSSPSSIDAVKKAARKMRLEGKIRAAKRDLHRSPLSLEELTGFDAVIFDPPRAGSLLQCQLLARSDVPLILAISCAPITFARDAEILAKGGYRLEKILLLDQFSYSFHTEIFASFRKP